MDDTFNVYTNSQNIRSKFAQNHAIQGTMHIWPYCWCFERKTSTYCSSEWNRKCATNIMCTHFCLCGPTNFLSLDLSCVSFKNVYTTSNAMSFIPNQNKINCLRSNDWLNSLSLSFCFSLPLPPAIWLSLCVSLTNSKMTLSGPDLFAHMRKRYCVYCFPVEFLLPVGQNQTGFICNNKYYCLQFSLFCLFFIRFCFFVVSDLFSLDRNTHFRFHRLIIIWKHKSTNKRQKKNNSSSHTSTYRQLSQTHKTIFAMSVRVHDICLSPFNINIQLPCVFRYYC